MHTKVLETRQFHWFLCLLLLLKQIHYILVTNLNELKKYKHLLNVLHSRIPILNFREQSNSWHVVQPFNLHIYILVFGSQRSTSKHTSIVEYIHSLYTHKHTTRNDKGIHRTARKREIKLGFIAVKHTFILSHAWGVELYTKKNKIIYIQYNSIYTRENLRAKLAYIYTKERWTRRITYMSSFHVECIIRCQTVRELRDFHAFGRQCS